MGRPKLGWKLKDPAVTGGIYSFRFTHEGKQYTPTTGHRDRELASQEAARIYARVVAGLEPARSSRIHSKEPAPERPIVPLAADWLQSVQGQITVKTTELYALHFMKHLVPHFQMVERVTPASVADYLTVRLARVKPVTLRKELSTLRQFLASLGASTDGWPKIPRRALGTAHANGKRSATEVSPEEVKEILRRLPARDRFGAIFRLRYAFAYETGLRPATLSALTVPQSWHRGQASLQLHDAADKNRMGRRVPLSRAARLMLALCAPEKGPIFGEASDHRDTLKKVAATVLGADRGATFTPYDLRRGMITHTLEETGNLPGTMWLVGHRQLATTSKYLKAGERAATDALKRKR